MNIHYLLLCSRLPNWSEPIFPRNIVYVLQGTKTHSVSFPLFSLGSPRGRLWGSDLNVSGWHGGWSQWRSEEKGGSKPIKGTLSSNLPFWAAHSPSLWELLRSRTEHARVLSQPRGQECSPCSLFSHDSVLWWLPFLSHNFCSCVSQVPTNHWLCWAHPPQRETLVGELVTAFPVGKAFSLGNAVETLAVHWLPLGQVVWPGQSAVTREVSQSVRRPLSSRTFPNDGNVLHHLSNTIYAARHMCLLNTRNVTSPMEELDFSFS